MRLEPISRADLSAEPPNEHLHCPTTSSLPLRSTIRVIAGAVAVLAAGAIACGPELTEPGEDISGAWFAPGPAVGLTDVTVNFVQIANGDLTGTYTATGTPGFQLCPASGPCNISGTLEGSNTVLQVFFELQDAGSFTGQVVSGNNLRGAMSRIAQIEPMEFVRGINAAP